MAKRKQNKPQDEYYLFRERITPKVIVRVYRPILTPEEYERRMEKIKKAATEVIIEMERRRIKEEREAREKEQNN